MTTISSGTHPEDAGLGAATAPLIVVEDLSITFGNVTVVENLSLAMAPGEIVGLVGESGSGKSITALAMMGLVPHLGQVRARRLEFLGEDLLSAPNARLEDLRGAALGMIFQEPMTALNPVLTIGSQIIETVRRHQRLGRAAARAHAIDMLARVGLPSPGERIDDYPHQLSGGMRQRVMIAMALACHPRLLIADEPTTALDVTIQAQILELLQRLQAETGMAIILITHDLGVVSSFVDRVLVMYAGRLIETAPVDAIFTEALHPYSAALLDSIPTIDADQTRLKAIPGVVPPPFAWPSGCRFAPRCSHARPACEVAAPPLAELRPSHFTACIRHSGYQAPTA